MDSSFLRGMVDELLGRPVRELGRGAARAATRRDERTAIAQEQAVLGAHPGAKEGGIAPMPAAPPPRAPVMLPDQALLENVALPRTMTDPSARMAYDIAAQPPAYQAAMRPAAAPPPSVPMPRQQADIRLLEQNLAQPAALPPTPEQDQAGDDREAGWRTVMTTAVEQEAATRYAFDAASRAYLTDQTSENLRARQAAERERIAAEREVERLIGIGQQSGYIQGGLESLGVGLDVIDKPRQLVIGEMGDEAYRRVTGQETGDETIDLPDWLTGAGMNVTEFDTWAATPANAALIANAYENGFQANPNAPRFEGGRAVWELYVNSLPRAQRALYDVVLDPLNLIPVGGAVGKGIKAFEEAASAALPGVVRGALRGTGTALIAPDVALNKTVDAVIPAVLRGAGNVVQQIPGVGPWIARQADFEPRVYLERKFAELTAAIQNARATQTQQGVLAPAAVPAPVTAPEVAAAAPPVAAPPAITPPLRPEVTEVRPAPSGLVDARGRPLTPEVTEQAPIPRTWTDPNLTAQAQPPTMIRGALDGIAASGRQAEADAWFQRWQADVAAPHEAWANQFPNGRARAQDDPLAHVTFLLTSAADFRIAFPDAPLGSFRFHDAATAAGGRAFSYRNIQDMIERAVFSEEADATAVRHWFRSGRRGTESFGGTNPATKRPWTGRELADELKTLRTDYQTAIEPPIGAPRSFIEEPEITPTASAESPLVSPEVQADAQAFTAPTPHPRRGELSIGKERGASKEQQILLGGETTIFATGPHPRPIKGQRTAIKRMQPDGTYQIVNPDQPMTRKEARETALALAEDFLDQQGDADLLALPKLLTGNAARRDAAAALSDAEVAAREADVIPENIITPEEQPAVERTAAGLQNVMPGAPDPELRLVTQEIVPEERVLTPEEQRAAEVAAGQTDMFGAPPEKMIGDISSPPAEPAVSEADTISARVVSSYGDGTMTVSDLESLAVKQIPVRQSGDTTIIGGGKLRKFSVSRRGNKTHLTEWFGEKNPSAQSTIFDRKADAIEAAKENIVVDAHQEAARFRRFVAEEATRSSRAELPPTRTVETAASEEALPSTGRGVPGEMSLPQAQIVLRPEDMQPRRNVGGKGFDPARVDRYVTHWDWDEYDRIKVWRDPSSGQYVVLGGHHRFAAMQRLAAGENPRFDPADFQQIPVKEFKGSFAEAKRKARRDNSTKKGLSPTSTGWSLREEIDEGIALADAVGYYEDVATVAQAKRFVAITHLSTRMQELVDEKPADLLSDFARMGDAVERGVWPATEAESYYFTYALPQNVTGQRLDDHLKQIARLKSQVQVTQGGLFDRGPASYLDTLAKSDELAQRLRSAKSSRATLRKASTDKRLDQSTVDNLRTTADADDRVVAELEGDLGLGPVVGRARPGDAVGIVNPGPALRRLWRGQAMQGYQQTVAAAANARATATALPPGTRPLPLADDVRATFDTRFEAAPAVKGERYEDVLNGILTRQTKRPMTFYEATDDELAQALRAFRSELKDEVGFKEAGRIGTALNTLSGAYGEWALLMPWKLPRYVFGNVLIGNASQIAIGGQMRSLRRITPRHIRAMEQMARGKSLGLDSPVGELFVKTGQGIYDPRLTSDGLTTAYLGKGESNMRRILNKAPVVSASFKIPHVRPIGWARETANGFEWAARTGLAGELYNQNILRGVDDFLTEAVEHAKNMAPVVPAGDVRAVLSELGHITDAATVRDRMERLARSYGVKATPAVAFADRIARDWANVLKKSRDGAVEKVNATLFSYEYRNIDNFVRKAVPFHYWMSRAIPWYAEQGLRHPGLAAAYYRAYEGMEHYADEQGWPDSLKGFVKLWDGPAGLMMMFSPLAAFGLLDVMMEQSGGYTPEHISAVGKVLTGISEKTGFGLLPWWGASLNWFGLMGDSIIGLDPVGTYMERKLFGGLLSLGRAEGWISGDPLSKPFEQRLRDIRQFLSGAAEGVIPGAHEIPASDASAYPREIVHNMMLDQYLQDEGISRDEFTAMGTAPEGSDEHERYEEILQTLVEETETNGTRYREAASQYARSQVGAGGWLNALGTFLIGGPKRVRQSGQMARGEDAFQAGFPGTPGGGTVGTIGEGSTRLRLPLEDPYRDNIVQANELQFLKDWQAKYGEPYAEGDLARLQASVREQKESGEWTPEARPLAVAQSEYHLLGEPDARALVDQWEAIAFADLSQPVTIGGLRYSAEQINALPQDARFTAADAWLLAHDQDGAAQKLRDDRKLYEESHPEYHLFKDWGRDVRKAWEEYGLASYRRAVGKENPNARRYFEEQRAWIVQEHPDWSAEQIEAELDMRTTTLGAYEAVTGIQHKYADPNPLESGEDPRPPGYGVGDGGGGSSSTATGGWETRATTAIAESEFVLGVVNQALTQMAGRPVRYQDLPPPVKGGVDGMLLEAGVELPGDYWIYEDFQEWSNRQRQLGGNPSIAAYVAATQSGPWKERTSVTLPGGGPTLVGGWENSAAPVGIPGVPPLGYPELGQPFPGR